MDDATPPNDRPEPPEEGASGPDQRSDSGLGPAYAILRAAFGSRMPKGPLGPETVSASVLALPITMATDELVEHAKRCQNPECPHVPAPLRLYRRGMRAEAIRKLGDQVHKVLWTHSNHELVKRVRTEIVERYADLAQEISTGSLLNSDRLGALLDELGTDGPRIVAAVLWAIEFKGPHAEALFRSLVPLVQSATSRRSSQHAANDSDVSSLKTRVRDLDRARKQAERAADEAKKALKPKDEGLRQLMRNLQDVQQKYQQTTEELSQFQERLRETEATLQSREREAEKTTRIREELRRELRAIRDSQRDLEVQRSGLAQQLAAARGEVKHLKLRPSGADAVWEFLGAERERIDQSRLILSGGDKRRADQEQTIHNKLEEAFLSAYQAYRQPQRIKLLPKAPLRLVALGGSGEVGRSCYLLELGKHRLLVDCGIKPGDSRDLHPDLAGLESIDALVLTHAHSDHIGWVPALVRKFGKFDIYCTDRTAALLPVMLDDCHRNYLREMISLRERARFSQGAGEIEDAYDEEDVRLVSTLTIGCQFDREEPLPFGGMWLRFFRAGHILGAASVLIGDRSGRRVFFSGDFSSFDQLTVSAASWPEDHEEIDLLVMESTYGDRNHPSLADSREELIAFIRDTVARGGSIILASFALGRAQELLKLIVTAQETGLLSASIPLHVDGMIRRINPIYRNFGAFSYKPGDFNDVSGEAERQDIILRAQRTPSVIVTTSGMLAGGPAVVYAQHLLPDARHRIVLAGYQDEGAPSRALLELIQPGRSRTVRVPDERGEIIEFEAAMPAKHVSLSSHADQSGLLGYAGRLRARHIALVHGEPKAQQELKSHLLRVHPRTDVTCGPSELPVP